MIVHRFVVVVQHDSATTDLVEVTQRIKASLMSAMPVTDEGLQVTHVSHTDTQYHHATCPHGLDRCEGCTLCGTPRERYCPDRLSLEGSPVPPL